MITPAAPTPAATGGDTSAAISWNAPAWNGGAAITSYTATASPGGANCTTISTSCTLTGLTNGTSYTVSLTATNSAGTGPAATTTVIPYPDTVMSSTDLALWLDALDGASLSAAGDCTGGNATTGTGVGCWKDRSANARHASAGPTTAVLTSSAINGRTALRFDRTHPDYYAVTGAGIGAVGSADRSVFAVAAGRTSTDAATNGYGALAVWPGMHSGLMFSGYPNLTLAYTAAYGQSAIFGGSQVVSGAAVMSAVSSSSVGTLTQDIAVNGHTPWTDTSATAPWKSYGDTLRIGSVWNTVTDWAMPLDGDLGELLIIDRAVTPSERRQIEEYLARKWGTTLSPQAPTSISAVPGDAQAAVSWAAPAWNGGGAVTGYTATAVPSDGALANRTCSATAPTTSCTVTGLTNGVTYTVSVTATNVAGAGPASAAASVIPYPATVMSSTAVKVWLDAQDGATLSAASDCTGSQATAGTGIGCWRTRSSTGWNAVSGATKAVLTAAAINGRPAVRFSRTHPDYYAVTAAGIGAVGSADRSVFAVAAGRTTADGTTNQWGGVATWPGNHSGLMFEGYPSATTVIADGYTSAGAFGGVQTVSGVAVLSAVSSTASTTLTQDVAVNGRSPSSGTRTAPWSSYGNNLRIGAVFNTIVPYANPLDGDIGELVVLNRAVTAAERRQIDEYLARKWGTTITPVAPTAVVGTAGNAQVALTWAAPSWNGGGAVTSYTATASPGGATCTSATTACTVTGLTNGTAYTFTVTATNSAGTGPASAASASRTPYTVPGAPTAVTATASSTTSGTASVAWTAPASNGGAAITSYTVTAVPGASGLPNATCTAASSPCSLSGLVDGVAYSVTATASNTAGAGAASTATSLTTYPASLLTGSAMRLWLDGGDLSSQFTGSGCTGAITGAGQSVGCWRDKSGQNNHVTQGTSTRRPVTVALGSRFAPSFDAVDDTLDRTGSTLPTGTSASTTFTVATSTSATPATDGQRSLLLWGTGTAGAGRFVYKPSGSAAAGTNADATPGATDSAYTTNAPLVSVSTFSSGSYAMRAKGRPPVTQTYAYNTGTANISMSLTASSWRGPVQETIVVNSAFSDADRRIVEEYLARKWGATITPQAPATVAATGGDGQATVSWTAPSWNGGAAVTSYTATASPGGATCTGTGTSCMITGLTNGTTYTVSVTATSSAGIGPASAGVTVIPYPATIMAPGTMALWLDAQDATTLSVATDCSGSGATTGQGIGCWKDKSSSGWHLARGGSSGTALLTAAAVGGKQAIRFVRTNPDYFESTAAGVGALGSADHTVVVVGTARTVTSTAGVGNGGTLISWQGYHQGVFAQGWSGTTTVDAILANGWSSTQTGMFPGVMAPGPWISSSTFSSAAGTLTTAIAVAGRGTAAAQSISGTWMAFTDQLRVGSSLTTAGGDYSFPLDGDVGEILVFNRALTGAERRAVEEYVARRWGLTIAPSAPSTPTLTSPASGQIAASWSAPAWNGGASVTSYTATASPGGATCTSAGTSCTISGLTPGATYSVSVTATNSAGSGPAGGSASRAA